MNFFDFHFVFRLLICKFAVSFRFFLIVVYITMSCEIVGIVSFWITFFVVKELENITNVVTMFKV